MKRLGWIAVLGLGLIAAPAAAFAGGPGRHGGHGHVRVHPRAAPVVRHHPAPVVRHHVAPQVRVVQRPYTPVWVPGYWTHHGAHRTWVAGAWTYPPYAGWHWVAPHWTWNGYNWVWQSGRWVPAY